MTAESSRIPACVPDPSSPPTQGPSINEHTHMSQQLVMSSYKVQLDDATIELLEVKGKVECIKVRHSVYSLSDDVGPNVFGNISCRFHPW